jgi:hypothetical protein
MAIPAPLAEFILLEHARRPLGPSILSLGRQTILFDSATLYRLLDACGISRISNRVALDTVTTEARLSIERSFITDDSFYRAFARASYEVMDVTGYEGATIIRDLSQAVPSELIDRFDFIFNGSVLDNIFDPAAALRHTTQMLAVRGRIMHVEMASNLAFEYLIYSPDWFLDYYVVNGFQSCRIYVCTFRDVHELKFGPWRVYTYHPRGDGNTGCSLREIVTEHAVIVVIAERRGESSHDRSPVQWCYRDDLMKKQYSELYARFEDIPPFRFRDAPPNTMYEPVGGFSYRGMTIQIE